MSKVSGKLCINFEVDTDKFKRDYVNFLYNIASRVLKDWNGYYEGIHLSLGEDDYVEIEQWIDQNFLSGYLITIAHGNGKHQMNFL